MTQNGLTSEKVRVPKQALQSERAVIGACLIGGRPTAARARQVLASDDFYQDTHRAIFKEICGLVDAGSEVDLVLLSEAMRASGDIGEIGGVTYLEECIKSTSTHNNVGDYAARVRWAALSRQIDTAIERTRDDQSPDTINRLADLVYARRALQVSGILNLSTDAIDALEADQADKDAGIPTRLSDVVLYKGDVLTVGARPCDGKTAALTKMMLLISQSEPCCYVTTEMTIPEMLNRIFPVLTGIPATKFNMKRLDKVDWRKIAQVNSDHLPKLRASIWAHPSPTIGDIQSVAVQSKCRVLFVDYLQRCTFPALRQSDARTYQIQAFMRQLKTFAAETGVRVVLACQLNRKRDKEKGPPVLADLADSAGVEQESVSVGFLWRPKDDAGQDEREIEWITAKQRKGPTGGRVSLRFRAAYVDMLSAFEQEKMAAASEPEPAGGEEWWQT